MRLKYYLRGLGLGIIFTVVILSISNNLNKKNDVSTSEVINSEKDTNKLATDKVTKDKTDKDKTDKDKSNEEDKSNSTENEKENKNITFSENAQSNENDSNPNESVTDTNLQQNQPESVSPQEVSPPAENVTPDAMPQIITINIRQGEYCRPVAQKLQDAGLIADAEDFRIYMGNIGYASNIHSGDFDIPVGSTYEEIANILIRK